MRKPIRAEENLFKCKACGGAPLRMGRDRWVCPDCGTGYPVEHGIVRLDRNTEGAAEKRKPLLDVHRLRKERVYFDRPIRSDVEFFGRLHSLDFTNFHAELIRPHARGGRVVDLGCGQIPYLDAVMAIGVSAYYGVDASRVSLRLARSHFNESLPLVLVQDQVHPTGFLDGVADTVISCEVIEHLPDPTSYLAEAHRVCRPGGVLSLSTPCVSMYLYPHNLPYLLRHPLRWYGRLNAHRRWEQAVEWHPGVRPSVLRGWLNNAGFHVLRHETRLWYYHTPVRAGWRAFTLLERMGMRGAGTLYGKYLRMLDRALATGWPVIRWAGIRQFVLARRD